MLNYLTGPISFGRIILSRLKASMIKWLNRGFWPIQLQIGGKVWDFYEPIHGSAPDIAGQGLANPFGYDFECLYDG